ncbi:MAG: ribosome-associated translation inhibitor RaiA [Campylobacterota bacterium]|nr:ribosome-associated translation inhibitor RaiA [Campylobacterota bacterium]
MNVSLVGRHVELTQPIKDHLNSAIETLTKYNLDIISVNGVTSSQERKGKRGFSVEFTINLAAKNSVVIKQRDDDLYAAIDIAIDRAQKALRRLHDRSVEHHKVGINEVKGEVISTSDITDASEAQEDEIIPVELELYKPVEVAEALENLKDGNKQFEVFVDPDAKTRVLFKRNDGRFGLY